MHIHTPWHRHHHSQILEYFSTPKAKGLLEAYFRIMNSVYSHLCFFLFWKKYYLLVYFLIHLEKKSKLNSGYWIILCRWLTCWLALLIAAIFASRCAHDGNHVHAVLIIHCEIFFDQLLSSCCWWAWSSGWEQRRLIQGHFSWRPPKMCQESGAGVATETTPSFWRHLKTYHALVEEARVMGTLG